MDLFTVFGFKQNSLHDGRLNTDQMLGSGLHPDQFKRNRSGQRTFPNTPLVFSTSLHSFPPYISIFTEISHYAQVFSIFQLYLCFLSIFVHLQCILGRVVSRLSVITSFKLGHIPQICGFLFASHLSPGFSPIMFANGVKGEKVAGLLRVLTCCF